MRRRAGNRYSLFKIGKIWHYRFQIGGKSTQRTTRQVKMSLADGIAALAFEAAQQAWQGKRLSPTINELASQWLEVHKRRTSQSYHSSVDVFRRLHLYELDGHLVCDITTSMVEKALNCHLADHALDSGNQWLKTLRMLTHWAIARRALEVMPWKVPLIKVQKRPRVVLPSSKTVPWLQAIDQVCARDPSIATAVRLMLGIGLREMEAAGARWEWLDWERGTYTPGETKGKEATALPVPAWLMTHLKEIRHRAGSSPFITWSKKGRRHKPGYARRSILHANKMLEIKGITPHRLRGTYATALVEQGLAPRMVQQLMRHRSLNTTIGYMEDNLALAIQAQEAIAKKNGM